MQSRILRWRFSSRSAAVLGLVVALPACDAAREEDDNFFRAFNEEGGVDEEPSDGIDPNKGSAGGINCPECGSHWTVVQDGTVAVYLDAKLGGRILTLADEGTFWHHSWRGQFESYEVGPADGYTVDIKPSSDWSDEVQSLQMAFDSAVLRIEYDKGFVDVRLRYVDNVERDFDIPPSLN